MTELEQYLHTFIGVDGEAMHTLLSYFEPTTLSKGDYFVKAGRVCEKLSFHRSGLIRIYASYEEKEVTQWISFAGNFLTDLSGIVLDEPCRFTMRALTHCELYTINKNDYNRLPEVIPQWSRLERILFTRCFGFMEARLFGLLAMPAEERYKALWELNPALFNEVPLKYLASMMGITPESLSRIRKKMGG